MRTIPSLFRSLALISMTWLASGCGGGKPADWERPPHSHPQPLEGSLVSNLETLRKGEYRSECELAYEEEQLEMLRAFDEKSEEITRVGSQFLEDENWRIAPLGKSSFVREPKNKVKAEPGWQREKYGWLSAIESYKKLKDTAVDQKWVRLNSHIKGMLSDDLDRVKEPSWYELDRSDEPHLREILTEADKCLKIEGCASVSLSKDALLTIDFIRGLQENFRIMNQSEKLSDKRAALRALASWTKALLGRFDFTRNEAIRRVSQNELQLPLDGTAFGDALEQLAGYIESTWKSPDLAVKVRWVAKYELMGAFRFIAEIGMGGRAYVKYSDQSIHLFPYAPTTTIAHEIGHVLGLPDRYYTRWSPKSCLYIQEFTEEDIMSNSSTGSISSSDWKTLTEAHPL